MNMRANLLVLTALWMIDNSASAATGPLFQPPVIFTFEQMLVHVDNENPRILAERDNVKIADEKVSQANAGFRPTLTANAATGRQRENVDGQNWQYGNANNISLEAIQPLFSGFGTLEQKRAAEARVLAARSHLLAVEQTVLLTAIGDWLELCEKERLLALNNDNLHHMKQFSEGSRQLFSAGDGTRTDVAQAESRVAQAEARYALSLAERDSARSRFESDTGLAAQPVDFPPLPQGLPASRIEAGEMAGNNPQVAQLEEEQKAAQHDIKVAESSLYPTLYLRGSVGEDNAPTLGLQRQRDDSITLNLSMPLYQGGGEYSRIREAKLRSDKTLQDNRDAANGILLSARTAWDNYYAAQSVTSSAARAAEAARQALEGVREEQRQGLRTLTEVLDEQSETLSTQVTGTQAQKNVRLEAYRLLAAIGKLNAAGLNIAQTPYDSKPHHDEVVPEWVGF